MSLKKIHTMQLNLKETLSCVTNRGSRLYFGTRKGSIVVIQDLKVIF